MSSDINVPWHEPKCMIFSLFWPFFAIFRNLLHTSSFSRPYIWRLLQIQHRFPNFSDFPHIWTIIYRHNWCKIKENWRCTQYPRFLAASHTGWALFNRRFSDFWPWHVIFTRGKRYLVALLALPLYSLYSGTKVVQYFVCQCVHNKCFVQIR